MSPMNDYYNEAFSGVAHGAARARQVQQSFQAVTAGFDKLPGERELKEDRVTYGVATGGDNVFAVTLPYPITTYTAGLAISVKMPERNTGPCTIDVDGLGAKEIRLPSGEQLQADYFVAGQILRLLYTDTGQGHFNVGIGGSGPTGPEGLPGVPYMADTSIVMAAPGDGLFRLNSGTMSSVTAIAIDDVDDDGNDISAYIAQWDDHGYANNRGYLLIGRPDGNDRLVFLVTSLTDNADWTQLNVSHVAGSALPEGTHRVGVQFIPIGTQGGITNITAGVGISGGGSSGDVSLGLAIAEGAALTALAEDDKVAIADQSNSEAPSYITMADLRDMISSPGDMKPTAAAVEPDRWLFTDGQALNRVGTYAALFTAIGTTFGEGDGVDTFNVPDTRGNFMLGASASILIGATGGAATVALTEANLAEHEHSGPSHSHGAGTLAADSAGSHTHDIPLYARLDSNAGDNVVGTHSQSGIGDGATDSAADHTHIISGSTGDAGTGDTGSSGDGDAHENMPPYVAINWLIRF